MQNDDVVENPLENKNYPCILFVLHEELLFKGVVVEVSIVDLKVPITLVDKKIFKFMDSPVNELQRITSVMEVCFYSLDLQIPVWRNSLSSMKSCKDGILYLIVLNFERLVYR